MCMCVCAGVCVCACVFQPVQPGVPEERAGHSGGGLPGHAHH